MTLTPHQYVALSGCECPACRSIDTKGGPPITRSALGFQRSMHCNNCGSTWLDVHQRVWRLVGYERLKVRRKHHANDHQG